MAHGADGLAQRFTSLERSVGVVTLHALDRVSLEPGLASAPHQLLAAALVAWGLHGADHAALWQPLELELAARALTDCLAFDLAYNTEVAHPPDARASAEALLGAVGAPVVVLSNATFDTAAGERCHPRRWCGLVTGATLEACFFVAGAEVVALLTVEDED